MSRWRMLLYAVPLCLAPAGCHRPAAPAPPPVPAPSTQAQQPITAASITVITPLPSVPATAEPNVQPASAQAPPPKPATARSRRRFHRAHKAPDETAQAVSPADPAPTAAGSTAETRQPVIDDKVRTTQPESEPTTADGHLSGQWSTGTAISSAQRVRLIQAIDTQEKRIGAIHNPGAPDTAAVLTQVKAFLEKARDAVSNNDLDGAQTLNMKAQVLLDELQEGS